jgi:hypothetical protein
MQMSINYWVDEQNEVHPPSRVEYFAAMKTSEVYWYRLQYGWTSKALWEGSQTPKVTHSMILFMWNIQKSVVETKYLMDRSS